MPVNRRRDKRGGFFQWGDHGKKYYYTIGDKTSREEAKRKATLQGRAAFTNGYRGKGIRERLLKAFQSASNAYRRSYLKSNPNANVRMLEPGELHWGLHNYTGPGTKLSDNHRDFKPYNNIDNASRIHDHDYEKASLIKDPAERARYIHEADRKAIATYNKYKSESGYLPAVLGIGGKYILEKGISKLRGKPTTLYGGRARKRRTKLI